jgi:hypothetical protein
MAAAAIVAFRKLRAEYPALEERDEEDNLLEKLVDALPARDTWEAEYLLGMLVLGCELF